MRSQEEFFNFLYSKNLTPNSWCQLYAIHAGISYNKYISDLAEISKLLELNMIECVDIEIRTLNRGYQLTVLGKSTIEDIEIMLNIGKKTPINQKEEWSENINIYRLMFPKGKKQGSNAVFRTNPEELYKKFVWFFSTYPKYKSWEVILKATKCYHEEFSSDLTYHATAGYFISKQDTNKVITSKLADYCQRILDDDIEEPGKIFDTEVL